MSNLRQKLQMLCITVLFGVISAAAQVEIRYVKMTGDNSNDGTSWASAKADIQDAINDLVNNNKTGEVWVAKGTYKPTESTSTSNSQYYKAFKIPAGITVRGGFKPDLTADDDGKDDNTTRPKIADNIMGANGKNGELDGEATRGGVYDPQYATILTGDLTDKPTKFTFNPDRQLFETTFYGNSYHVVWFATNGFNATTGRANPLSKPAKLEGCVIEGGHATTRDASENHAHEGYGGGIYMVANSFVYNCEVRHCDASRNGGGIYMDGGGIVRRTYVHDCQALGLGTEYGMGGGICEEGAAHNSKQNPIVVAQSAVTNCVGRIGGGMALLADKANGNDGKNKYTIVANSTLVNNNTAQIEAGGVYTYKGGGVASLTIVNNKCNGSGITQNGVITGRAGGLYSRDAAYVGNTVIWGNECQANQHVQYANSRSSLSNTEKSLFRHNALSNADLSDWSATEKLNVISLANKNTVDAAHKEKKGYTMFMKPTTTAGYLENYTTIHDNVAANDGFNWNIYSESALTHAGINTADLDTEELTPAPQGKAYDMMFDEFNARPSIGAFVAEVEDIAPKVTGTTKHEYFVDPNYNYSGNNTGNNGESWNNPARFLGNVLDYIQEHGTDGKEIFIYVKEGVVNNTRYKSNDAHVRTTSLEIPSNVTMIGSFASDLEDTDLSRRNPVLTPTVISAQLMGNYQYNVAHLITIEGKKNITIDGFKLTFANAFSTQLTNTNQNGAAITLKGCKKNVDETTANIHFVNITVSNCYGDKGTVVYADNSWADFENCIFHNNTTYSIMNSGLIYGINNSNLRFEHCNVLRSVGHVSYLDGTTHNEWKNSMFYGNLSKAQDNTNNCQTLAIAAFEGPGADPANLTGERCMFDLVSKPLYDGAPFYLGAGIPANSTYYVRAESKGSETLVSHTDGLAYPYTSGWANGYPRMVNPTKNAGYSTEGDITYYGRATSFEPHNDNPVVNAAGTGGEAHSARSWGKDITTIITRDFGGLPDIGAVESHVASAEEIGSENGNPDGQMPYGVAYYVRDYAQPDMPKTYTKNSTGTYDEATGGLGNYVKEGESYVFLDGASWQYAVSGNANYGSGENKDVNAVFYAKEKTPGTTTYKTFTIKNTNRTNSYLYITSTGSIGLTTSATDAAKWTVSNTNTSDGTFAIGSHTVSTIVNGSTYYLSFNGSKPILSKNTSTNVYLTKAVTTTSTTSAIRTVGKTYYYYNTSSSTNLNTATKEGTYTNWSFIRQETHTDPTYEEAHEPTDAVANGNVAQNDKVAAPMKLHVYKSLNDFKNLGSDAVTYKIGQFEPSNSTASGYVNTTNTTYYYATTAPNVADGHAFAIIASNVENQYFIYDVTTSRYLYYTNNSTTPIRETATESSRSPWYIIESETTGRFNIALASTGTIPEDGWNKGTSYINLATRTDASAQWVLVAQKSYNQYKKTVNTGEYLNGLQYAVNTVHDEFVNGGTQHQVHVAKGVYTNTTGNPANPSDASNVVSQPYAYMMQEGVNVLGGYPYIGNPGEEQREPKVYETILQPQTESPYVSMTFKEANGPQVTTQSNKRSDMMHISSWGSCANATNSNDKSSVGRVLVQPNNFKVATSWDGFTLRYGYLNTAYRKNIDVALRNLVPDNVKTAGGAGALLQGNGALINCKVTENLILVTPGGAMLTVTGEDKATTVKGKDKDGKADSSNNDFYTNHTAGAGIFMTGSDNNFSVVENCEISKNELLTKAVMKSDKFNFDHIWMYGVGLFQNGGNVYNTIIHDNDGATVMGTDLVGMSGGDNCANEMILGAGAFVAMGNFYNNTIVANTSTAFYHAHLNHCSFAGIHVFDEATIYNSLIADNISNWGFRFGWNSTNSSSPGAGVPVCAFDDTDVKRSSRNASKVHVKYSFVNVYKGEKNTDNVLVDLTSLNGENNIYLNYNPNVSGTVDYEDDTPGAQYHTTKGIYNKTGASQYQLTDASPCINTGLSPIPNVVIPDFDAGYDDRVQDCRIDIGAYESDGSATIAPQSVGTDQLVFYVTPEGKGATSAKDPNNAACAAKLQKVLDAAGRYKLANRKKQVIVKVANSWDMFNANATDRSNFTYYATRTTDQNSTDTRMWSIQIPRGVEVWGGYTDVPTTLDADGNIQKNNVSWDNDNNGFTYRSITQNPTYFDSYFYNKDMKINATTYHVVTFTERVFDVNGNPYLKTDYAGGNLAAQSSFAGERDEALFLHMSDVIGKDNVIMADASTTKKIDGKTVSNRAVLDGIFVTGGNADGKSFSGSSNLNVNGYGGAAIVTDYAYVRNCIVMDNNATNGGGLALTDHALVSGSLIIKNNADNMGGGLYVFEDGATLSDGRTINSTAPTGQIMDYSMAHVLTTTIAENNAQHGGGVWYTDGEIANARFNSVLIWQNTAADQANVFGTVNPEQPTTDETLADEYYPFSYSVIQNVRGSGTNNMSTENLNNQGVRFVKADSDIKNIGHHAVDLLDMAEDNDNKSDFGFYGLSRYSILSSNGMPASKYEQLYDAIAISDVDLVGTNRITTGNKFVEIGARALAMEMPKKQLMLRLFVAHPEDVDTELAGKFMRLNAGAEPADKTSPAHKAWEAKRYYSQMGSSFAYPFNSLQDALDYIKMARNGQIITGNTESKDLPFEILVGKGYYYPKKDLNGGTISVWAQTFAIPEGVTIMGGFDPKGGSGTYYGRYYQKGTGFDADSEASIYDNVDPIPTQVKKAENNEIGRGYKSNDEDVTFPSELGGETITFQQWHIQDIADRRRMKDINNNGITEPWEFENQTVISGNAVNGETDGVYHVMTAVADADAVGLLPKVKSSAKNATDFTGYNSTTHEGDISLETGYQVKEEGQQIRLNGLVITGGNALTYLKTALDEYGKYIFYQGAGLQVDGNRYNKTLNGTAVFHNSAAYGVGYRDIPVSITNCQFRNNVAGYGGAISSNGSLSIFASSFEQNMALAQTENRPADEEWDTYVSGNKETLDKVMYPGQGGAILATYQLSAFNTLFANNEARLGENEAEEDYGVVSTVKHPTFRVPVRNDASATLRAAGGAIMMGSAAEHHIVNCDFVRNKANSYPAVFTMNPTFDQNPDNVAGKVVDTHKYSQIINTVAWGNEVNPVMLAKYSENANYKFASKLLVNVGQKGRTRPYIETRGTGGFYDPTFSGTNTPTSQSVLDNTSNNWQEAVWFCAYEAGTGFTPNNTNDLRDAIVYSPKKYAPDMIKAANNGTYQNCNIEIVADNENIAGPNFGTPSVKAGFDGYTEGADWSPSRFNRLTDNGNGWIEQSVDPADLKVTFHNNDTGTGTHYQGAYSVTHYISDLTTEKQFPEYKLWLAIGNEKYMQATKDQEAEEQFINNTSIGTPQKNLPRISPDPTLGVQKAYIDIGVFEYIKQPLLVPGGEVDVLWVSTKEHPENGPADGLTWRTPTSDLQRAIETLLSSRNGHKKEIRIMEGEYTPVKTHTVKIGGVDTKFSTFYINTKDMNERVVTPTSFNDDGAKPEDYYTQSLTIKGGYSSTADFDYNPDKYKTVIRQADLQNGINGDHLIYIDDATQRYAWKEKKNSEGQKTADAYRANNNYGAYYVESDDPHGEAKGKIARTMPIQIDGITLINDKAAANAQGAAIYYPNTVADIKTASTVTVGSKVTYYDEEHAPSAMPTDNFSTKIYYTDAGFTELSPKNAKTAYFKESGNAMENPAKLVINKAQIIGSGKPSVTANSGSAVYIGQYGGSALIYNTVFHSNYGMPLDAYNTVNVNNTFGKNLGLVQLNDMSDVTTATGVASEMHNSALWKNNWNSSTSVYDAQVTFSGVAATYTSNKFTYNSLTGGPEGDQTSEKKYNTRLIEENNDLAEGPNFVDPENVDIEARSFDLKPSVRLLNKANGTRTLTRNGEGKVTSETYAGLYSDKVVNAPCVSTTYENYDYSLVSSTDKDVAYRDRIIGAGDANKTIDVGAYEFQGNLQRVLYYDPNKSYSSDATGENWDKAFGYGDLQNAINLAAIYHMNSATTPKEESYVFAKGASATNSGLNTNETLTIRDGVTVYGSITSSYTDWHDDATYHEKTIDEYITDMVSLREGVASNSASKTIVTGIKTDGGTYDGNSGATPALIDGFVVTDPNGPKAPVVDITNTSDDAVTVLRNIIVADNEMTGTNVDVTKVTNGLIYEVLMRDNKPTGTGAVLNMNGTTKAYAVNVTVEGKTVGANGSIPVDGADETNTHIYKSITNSIGSGSGKKAGEAAPYGAITNAGISGKYYNIADANLNYQLTETSTYINECDAVNPLCDPTDPATGVAPNLAKFINYLTDRDILGNPRVIAGVNDGKIDSEKTIGTGKYKLDRGAFETWKVDLSENGDIFYCGEAGTISKNYDYKKVLPAEPTEAQKKEKVLFDLIKKHYYPHDGSVCYIMEGQSLVIDAFDPTHEVKPTPHNPGFMLVKKNANFYGNGRPATCAYLAIERDVPATGAVVSVPFAMDYHAGVAKNITATNADLNLDYRDASEARYYDGSKRSDWKHIFQTGYVENDANNCWVAITEATAAGNGVFYKPAEALGAGLYRFTGKGTGLTDYIYTEEGTSKDVVLTKYDDAESTNSGADFTDNLDMGWNCFGLPYLVSHYEPSKKVRVDDPVKNTVVADAGGNFSMDIPHTLWLYYDGVHTPDNDPEHEPEKKVDGNGGYYSVNSWESGYAAWHVSESEAAKAAIWVGEGIFTQTATLDDTENLKFYLPVAPTMPNSAKSFTTTRYYYDATGIVEKEMAEDVELIGTEFYTTDGIRIDAPRRGAVTIIRKLYSNGSTRTSKQFVK